MHVKKNILSVGSVNDTGTGIEIAVQGQHGLVFRKGPLALIMNSFCDKYNMSYRLIYPQDNTYGVAVNGDKFNGVIGQVQSGEVDLGGTFFSMMAERQRVVDFSEAVGASGFSIMMKTPKYGKTKNVLNTFTFEVWIAILVIWITMLLVIHLFVNKIHHKADQKHYDKFTLSQLILFLFGALVKQGSHLSPSSDFVRILFGAWWMFITIVTAFYTAELTAVLASSSRTLPINNLDEMYKASSARWVARGGGVFETMVERWPEYVNLKQDIESGKGMFISSNEKAFSKMRSRDNMYFLAETKDIRRFLFHDYEKESVGGLGYCEFTYTDHFTFASVPIGLIFPKKNNTLKIMFNIVIQELLQAGLLQQSMRGDEDDVDIIEVCEGVVAGSDKPLMITDVGTIFLITGIGCAIAASVFIIEEATVFFHFVVDLIERLKEYDKRLQRRRKRINLIRIIEDGRGH